MLCTGLITALVFHIFRYNLHTEESDVDMFIVYAADTANILGFNQPQQTVKVTTNTSSVSLSGYTNSSVTLWTTT